MARVYSRKKGKSGSKKPVVKKTPSWLRHSSKEVEMLVIKLAKSGKTTSQIGLHLRDVYGIPDVRIVCDKKITQILADKKLTTELPEDLLSLIKRSVSVRKHLEKNKQDKTAKRGLQITESKILRLVKYYKGTGKLAIEWKYDPAKAQLLLE